MDGQSVLIVDDEPEIRRLAQRALSGAGYRTREAGNGFEAIAGLEAYPHDLVVIDIIMPDKEGIETIREIRRRWPSCRIVAISGGGRLGPNDVLDLAGKFGADATLSKPMSFQNLVATVRRVLAEPQRH